jgi:hypothetical protein
MPWRLVLGRALGRRPAAKNAAAAAESRTGSHV